MSMSLHCILLTGIWTLKTIRGNVLHDLPSQTLNTSYCNDRISNDDLIRHTCGLKLTAISLGTVICVLPQYLYVLIALCTLRTRIKTKI